MRPFRDRIAGLPLRSQLLLAFGAAIGLLLLALATAYPVSRDKIEERLELELRTHARTLSVGVAQLMEEARRDVMELCTAPSLRTPLDNATRAEEAQAYLRAYMLRADGRFLAVRVFDARARLILDLHEQGLQGIDRAPPEPLAQNLVAIGGVEPGIRPPGIVVKLSATLYDAGQQVIGSLVASYDAYPIVSQIVHSAASPDEVSLLVCSSGHVCSSNRLELTGQTISPALRELIRPEADVHTIGPLTERDAECHLVGIAAIPASRTQATKSSLQLFVLAARPVQSVQARTHQLIMPMFGSALLLIILLGLGTVLLVGRMIRPLGRLTGEVQTLQERLCRTAPQEPASTSANEVGLLHSAFDRMSWEVEMRQADLQQLVERMQRADRIKDEFLSFLSHEVRTPLTSIRSFAEILRESPDIEEGDRQEFLTIIESECDRLTQLCGDLLDLAKIDAGEMPWREEDVDLGEIVRKVQRTTSVLATRRGVHLEHRLNQDLPRLHADQHRLIQVLTNLVSNALKFTPSGGAVTLRAGTLRLPEGTIAYLAVLDTGPGIPEAFQQRIFDPFVQAPLESDFTPESKGTGLGLAICTRIVQHYGGRIVASNRWLRGAAIHVLLPLRRGDVRPAARSGEGAVPRHALTSPL